MDVIETDRADVQVNSAGATSYVNNYKIVNMLGEGTFSKVYLCQNETGNEFALKVINKSILKRKREYKRVDGKLVLSNAFQKVQKEVAIMKKLAHSNLVRLYEVIDSPADDKLFLVLELIRGGQIMYWDDKKFRYFAKGSDSGVLSKETVRECLRDVVAALDFLHRNHICHRDIKPENILLSGDQYKVADFGVAHMNENESSVSDAAALKLRSTEGTYHFLAPECTTGDEYDPYQVDVWAVGVTMFTLLLGTLPFGTSVASLSDVMTSIREDPLVLPSDLDPECAALLTQLLEKNPRLRITIPQLQAHPWLSGGGERSQRSSGTEVMVTQQEIEAAFTPVNNFILVMKLKLKMSSRLNNARKSLASNVVPVTKHTPAGDEATGQKMEEMAPCEQPQATSEKLQRRSSRMMETISGAVGSVTRRKSQLGTTMPVFNGPVPSEDSPSVSNRPGSLVQRVSKCPDTAKEETENLSPGQNDVDTPGSTSLEGDELPAKSEKDMPANILRLTKRKSTSYRGLVRAIEIPEGGGDKSESTSPINRKKRRESIPLKRDSSSDLSLQSTVTSDKEATGDSNARPSLARKNSMSFRALMDNGETPTDTVAFGPSSAGQGSASIPLPTTKPAVLSRKFSRRNSRSVRVLNTSPQLTDGALTTDLVPNEKESKTNSSPPRPVSPHPRRSSMPFRALIPMSVSEASPIDGDVSSTMCQSPAKSESGSPSLARRQSRCNSTSGDVLDNVQGAKDTGRLPVESEPSPTKTNGFDARTLPSPRLKSVPHSPLKTKVHDLNKDQHLEPLRKANLPVLDLNLSPISSPLASPVGSPQKETNSSDDGTAGEPTVKRRSSSPSKAIEETHLEALKIAPLTRKRSSSLKGFSSGSDEETLPKSASTSAIVPTATTSVSPASDRRFTFSTKPTSPLPEANENPHSSPKRLLRNRSMNAVEDDDPSNTLLRKTSLAKVLDACMPPRSDQSVEEVKTLPVVDTETPLTPIRRHVHVPPLIRPENPEPHHQISPLSSVAPTNSPPQVIDSANKEPPPLEKTPSRRKSLALAQDSMRVLFRGKSSVRLNLLEEKRGANYVTNDKVRAITSKVCGIM